VYHTFGILEAKPREEIPEDPRMGPLLDRHTEDAIDAALRLRGYQLRTGGPVDFLVAYSNEIRRENFKAVMAASMLLSSRPAAYSADRDRHTAIVRGVKTVWRFK